MAKKTVKKTVADLAEIKHEHKHEDIKQFLKRKLRTFGKFKQTNILKLRRCYDPVRCTTCGKIVFYVADIKFDDEHTNKSFEVQNVCADCLDECNVKFMTGNDLIEFISTNKGQIGISKLRGMSYNDMCDLCWEKTIVTPVWVYADGIPLKICLCEKDMPKPDYTVEPTLSVVNVAKKIDALELEKDLKAIE